MCVRVCVCMCVCVCVCLRLLTFPAVLSRGECVRVLASLSTFQVEVEVVALVEEVTRYL